MPRRIALPCTRCGHEIATATALELPAGGGVLVRKAVRTIASTLGGDAAATTGLVEGLTSGNGAALAQTLALVCVACEIELTEG